MAYAQITETLTEIGDCIVELKSSFSRNKQPIDDNCITLHHLEEKLETLLLLGLNEQIEGNNEKQSYWDYISRCFSSQTHEALDFVNSSQLKTSVGRGRAFLRVSLGQKCLADVLTTCFMDKLTTSEFYMEQSLPLQPNFHSSFLTMLKDLNEVTFHLNLPHEELDVSWPTFARKLLASSDSDMLTLTEGHIRREEPRIKLPIAIMPKIPVKLNSPSSCDLQIPNGINGGSHPSSEENETSITHKYRYVQNTNDCDKQNSVLKGKELEYNDKCDDNIDYKSSVFNDNDTSQTLINGKDLRLCANNKYPFSSTPISKFSKSDSRTTNDNACPHLPSINQKSEFQRNISEIEAPENDGQSNLNSSYVWQIEPVKFELIKSFSHLDTQCSDYLQTIYLHIESLKNNIECTTKDPCTLSTISDLKSTVTSLKDLLLAKLKAVKNFDTHISYLDSYAAYLKSCALEQAALIDSLLEKIKFSLKENKTLYDKLNFLKDKLNSHGLLKFDTKKSLSASIFSQPFNQSNYPVSDDFLNDCQLNDAFLSSCLKPLHIFKTSYFKLTVLNHQLTTLQLGLESSQKLNDNLVSRVQDQEFHIRGIKRELEEAHQLLSTMKNQHKKLQTTESIVKYDLQEKRKLLTKLKQQLAATRKDSNLVKLKNSKSEIEWQNLRKEFSQRNKQNSEESGFVDDKSFEDTCDNNLTNNTKDYTNLKCVDMDEKQVEQESDFQILHHPFITKSSGLNNLSNNEKCELPLDDNSEKCMDEPTLPYKTHKYNHINDQVTSVMQHNSDDNINSFPDHSIEKTEYKANLCNDLNPISSQVMNPVQTSHFDSEHFQNTKNCKMEEIDEHAEDIEVECIGRYSEKFGVEEQQKTMQIIENWEMKNKYFTEELNQKTQELFLTEETKEEIAALQSQLNAEVLKYQQALKETSENSDGLNTMKQKVYDQELHIQTLEETLAEIQIERESEKEQQWEELQDIHFALLSREEECKELSADLEKLKHFKKHSLKDQEVMGIEILNLRNDTRELRKKVIKLLKEKDNLWKKNEYLAHLQKIQFDDRWMSDSEVSECLECKSQFTFTLRKHHCRHCGRIFCATCSNNWISTPSSRKQLRVCNECYNQLLKMKIYVSKDISESVEDSDDEANDNFSVKFLKRSTLCHNICSSIAHSTLSLSAPESTNLKKSNFTSTPNLYSANESSSSNIVLHPDQINKREIARHNSRGDLFIKANQEAVLSIFNKEISTFFWNIMPVNDVVPICLIYEDSSQYENEPKVLHQSSCEIEGVIRLFSPGVYKFHLDNRAKLNSVLLNYSFKEGLQKRDV